MHDTYHHQKCYLRVAIRIDEHRDYKVFELWCAANFSSGKNFSFAETLSNGGQADKASVQMAYRL